MNKNWVFISDSDEDNLFRYNNKDTFRNYIRHIEEYTRWFKANRDIKVMENYVIYSGYKGLSLSVLVKDFYSRVAKHEPKYIVYQLSLADIKNFKKNLDEYLQLILRFIELAKKSGVLENNIILLSPVVDSIDDFILSRQFWNQIIYPFKNQDINIVFVSSVITESNQRKFQLEVAKMIIEKSMIFDNDYLKDLNNDLNTLTVNETEKFYNRVKYYGVNDNQLVRLAELFESDNNLEWLFLGDSITHGSSWTNGHKSFTQIFEEFLRYIPVRNRDTIINSSVSGATVESTLENISSRFHSFNPDITSIMLGSNDAVISTTEKFMDELDILVSIVKQQSQIVIIRTPPPTFDESRQRSVQSFSRLIIKKYKKDKEVLIVNHNDFIMDILTERPNLVKNIDYQFFTDETKLHLGINGQLAMYYTFVIQLGLIKSIKEIIVSEPSEASYSKEINSYLSSF